MSNPRFSRWLPACVAAVIAAGCGADTTESSATSANEVLTVTGPVDSLRPGQSYPIAALDSAGHSTPVTWSSSAPGVADVRADGMVHASVPGMATISAAAISGVAHGKTLVRVGLFRGVKILPAGQFGDTVQIGAGQPLQLTPFEYSDETNTSGTLIVPTQIAWSSSDAKIATVDATGLTTGVAPGLATITATIDQQPATRLIRVVATSGTATIRLISVAADYATVTMRPNLGTPATLTYGATSEQVVPAGGTLQLSFDEAGFLPQLFYNNPNYYELQVFVGLLPAGAHETFIAVSNPGFAASTGIALSIARLDDRVAAVPADSAAVRVVLATSSAYPGYNVFFTTPGGPADVLALQGCYLDWPYGFTDYAGRTPGDFDIVLQTGKFSYNGPEVARFHVTALAGHATTFILTGNEVGSIRVISVVDR